MTVQVLTNGDPALAAQVGRDMAAFAWRRREALLDGADPRHGRRRRARPRRRRARRGPVVLADHSDRSGAATWLLREIVAQELAQHAGRHHRGPAVVDRRTRDRGVKVGDAFDMEIGGPGGRIARAHPVRIRGTSRKPSKATVTSGSRRVRPRQCPCAQHLSGADHGAVLAEEFGLDIGAFEVMAIKSRVHFRRGFHDNGFAKTILLVEPSEPFLGTIRLDKLPYENVDLKRFYPYGNPDFA